ncbi:MAG: HD domain-containing protein [Bacteroidales bacterium]|nr:HD domain-containing protein [Bacteroidales bacterium]
MTIQKTDNTRTARQEYLLSLIHPNDTNYEKIREAFALLASSCGDKRHADGTLPARHSVEVAISVVEELGFGSKSVLASLLHTLPHQCDVSVTSIEQKFGKEVAALIEGFQTISAIRIEKPSLYSDNFRNLLLSLVKDIRIILIKLIDRMHMMRTLDGVDDKTKKKLCDETFYLYAPLAHRLGLYRMKMELEDNAMKHAYPEVFHSITRKLSETKKEREDYIAKFITPVKADLQAQGFVFEIKGRSKSVFSIWQKMRKQNVSFGQVYDVFAIRIIIENIIEDEKADCWKVYSILTNRYIPNPKRLRDWVTVPKQGTGYESLHTTVQGPGGRWVEVQIRTRRMDNIAEKGQAAHWKYKEGPAKASV